MRAHIPGATRATAPTLQRAPTRSASRRRAGARRPRRRRPLAILLTLFGVGAARAALATPTACTLDREPAATLLLPYFEVDLANGGGRTTLISIATASSQSIVANVTLWTDLGVPTLHFNVYLTGYDVQTINLRDLFAGKLPQTAAAAQDPSDHISPKGDFSQDSDVATCNGILPYPASLPDAFVDNLRQAHIGNASSFGGCAGQHLGDAVARGYVTVDALRGCTLSSPVDPGYFAAGGTGIASDANVLWGDYMLVDPEGNSATGDELVRVQAFPGRFHSGDTTFYGRTTFFSAADDREPLGQTWLARFLQGGAFNGGTDLIVWRDPGQPTAAFDCASQPSWYPLPATVIPFDEQENAQVSDTCNYTPCHPSVPVPFPALANLVPIAGTGMVPSFFGPPVATSFDFGWLYLRLAEPDRQHEQAWVGQTMRASQRFAVGLAATPLDSGCAPLTTLPTVP